MIKREDYVGVDGNMDYLCDTITQAAERVASAIEDASRLNDLMALPFEQRVLLAEKLCEGTSSKVGPR